VAFQTRAPLHRAQYEITLRASKGARANLLIHPVTGVPEPGDLNHYTRVRCYEAVLSEYPTSKVMLSLLPLAMRMAGPREALWHSIIRRNYGCSHLIVGRDHAGPAGKTWYEPYAAQKLLKQYKGDIGVQVVPFKKMAYVKELDDYVPEEEAPKGTHILSISDDDVKQRLELGRDLPSWFTFPAVTEALRKTHPPRYKMGFTLFFTGLSGAGKSTIANVLRVKFLEMGGRPVTLLDGDIVRTNLSSELGFSKEHRDINIRRIGFVASEITKNGGIAICAPIAPYESVREEVRQLIERRGSFVLVYVATPLDVCETRDRKGMYAKARAGIIKEFTGISDPYEEPKDAEVVIDTSALTPEEAAQEVILYLEQQGFLSSGQH
jgi:sulfate adenylyltransferase